MGKEDQARSTSSTISLSSKQSQWVAPTTPAETDSASEQEHEKQKKTGDGKDGEEDGGCHEEVRRAGE